MAQPRAREVGSLSEPDDDAVVWSVRTTRFPATGARSDGGAHRVWIDGLPVASLMLSRAGIVTAANRAFCELVMLPEDRIVGEPLLTWIARSGERESFGRAFMALQRRDAGGGFVHELSIEPASGPAVPCILRAAKIASGQVVASCELTRGDELAPDAEIGRAIMRNLDALDQGFLLVDGGGRIVHGNPGAKRLLGEAIAGRSLLELANPSTAETLTRALAVGRAGNWQGEVELRRLDGEPLPVELSLAAGAGRGSPAVVLFRDLRERRRRAFEERLMAQVDRRLVSSAEPRESTLAACAALSHAFSADRVIVIVRIGAVLERWQLANDRQLPVERLHEQAQAPARWNATRDPEPLDLDDPALRALFGIVEGERSAMRVSLQAPRGVVGQLLIVHRNDRGWDARDRALLGLLASQIALGLSNGLLSLEARALAAYQAMVLDQTSVLLNTVDAEGRVVTWNRASEQLLGVGGEEAIGKRFGIDVAKTVDPDSWVTVWDELLRDGVIAHEMTVFDNADREVPLHLEGRVLRDGEHIRGAVLVGLDLRDRRTLERQVLRSQKLAAVGLLAAGIAHEINNPLSGVVGYSNLLLEQDLTRDVRDKVEKIARSGERCRKIVEGVLLFSRQQDGGMRRTVDVRQLMDRVIGIGEYQWRMHNVRIVREHEESVEVFGDTEQLEQVVLNLLSNAVDAMPRGGTVRISLKKRPDGAAELTVTDDGPGVPEEIQARIFDPFFTTKDIGKGTGLGLAISYGIVHDHGGDILVESVAGHGAMFKVILPPDGKPRGDRHSDDARDPSSTNSTAHP